MTEQNNEDANDMTEISPTPNSDQTSSSVPDFKKDAETEIQRAVDAVLEPLGGNLAKGWWQAGVFGLIVGTFAVGLTTTYGFLLYQVLIMLGAMAIAIAVQQAYLSSSSEDSIEAKRIYSWGVYALVSFGLAAISEGLTHGPHKIKFEGSALEMISVPLLCSGFVALYRFIALYFLRGTDQNYIESGGIPLSIFNKNAPKLMVLDIFLAIGVLLLAILIFLQSVDGPIKPDVLLRDTGLLGGVPAQSIYGFNYITGLVVFAYLAVSYALSLYFYVPGIKRITVGSENESTIRFFQAMVKWFYLPSICQAILFVALWYAPAFSVVENGVTSYQFSDGPFVVLWAVAILLGFSTLILLNNVKTAHLRSISWYTIGPTLAVAATCFTKEFYLQLPVPYLMLGFLTLAFAYLPARDLIRLRESAKSDKAS
jgi:hypothetical protein